MDGVYKFWAGKLASSFSVYNNRAARGSMSISLNRDGHRCDRTTMHKRRHNVKSREV
jgi:hypothetical protein